MPAFDVNRSTRTRIINSAFPIQTKRRVYENEARRINDTLRDVLAISQNEKPYDVFICYMETDDTANELKQVSLHSRSRMH